MAFALAGSLVTKVLPKAPGCSRAVAAATTALALAGVTSFAACAALAAYAEDRLPADDAVIETIWLSHMAFGAVVGCVFLAFASLVAMTGRQRG